MSWYSRYFNHLCQGFFLRDLNDWRLGACRMSVASSFKYVAPLYVIAQLHVSAGNKSALWGCKFHETIHTYETQIKMEMVCGLRQGHARTQRNTHEINRSHGTFSQLNVWVILFLGMCNICGGVGMGRFAISSHVLLSQRLACLLHQVHMVMTCRPNYILGCDNTHILIIVEWPINLSPGVPTMLVSQLDSGLESNDSQNWDYPSDSVG